MTTKYRIPFQADSGAIWVEGPFGTDDNAMAERERAKRDIRLPSKYGVPFSADNKEEAEKKAKTYLP